MANSAYVFCPLCGTQLGDYARYGQMRRACPACSFVHFADPKVAVIGLIHHNGQILLARRAVDPAKGKWALPGGFMDAGEMPASALRRELMEEVALPIVVETLLDIFPMTGHGPVSRGIVLAYLARPAQTIQGIGHAGGPSRVPPKVQARDDVSEAGWFHPAQLPGELAFESTRTLLDLFVTTQTGGKST